MFWVVGEVSLPGGKAEEGDKDDGHTATREAKEEIGLDPSLVNVVTIVELFLSKVLAYVTLFCDKNVELQFAIIIQPENSLACESLKIFSLP